MQNACMHVLYLLFQQIPNTVHTKMFLSALKAIKDFQAKKGPKPIWDLVFPCHLVAELFQKREATMKVGKGSSFLGSVFFFEGEGLIHD